MTTRTRRRGPRRVAELERSWLADQPALAAAMSHPLLDAAGERACYDQMQAAKKARRQLKRRPQIALLPDLVPEHVARQKPILETIQAGREAEERLYLHNLRLVSWVAKRYLWAVETGQITSDDLFDEGCIGLSEAIGRWNPEKGRFTTVAVWWVRRAIGEFLYRRLHTIRVPTHLQARVESLRRRAGLGKTDAADGLAHAARHAGIGLDRLVPALNAQVAPVSLEAARDGDDEEGGNLLDLLAAPNSTAEEAERALRYEAAEQAIAALPNPDWQAVLRLLCGFDVPAASATERRSGRHQKEIGMSQQEVGEYLGFTRAHVAACIREGAAYLTGAGQRHHLRALLEVEDDDQLDALCQPVSAESLEAAAEGDVPLKREIYAREVQRVESA